MPPFKCLCNQCAELFELPEPHGATGEKEAKCPECGSTDIVRLNVRTLSVRIDEIGPPPWEYVCYKCKTWFELPVPHGPDEEKEAKCPECGSTHIERLNVCSLECIEHPFG